MWRLVAPIKSTGKNTWTSWAAGWAAFFVHVNTGYVAAILVLMWGWGDRWWPATLLLFGPRWILTTPFLLVLPLACLARGRALLSVLLAALAAAGPLLGGVVPWRLPTTQAPQPALLSIRMIAVNCGQTDQQKVIHFVREMDAEIVTLHEWHPARDFPERLSEGYHMERGGGNVVLSRFPITSVEQLDSPDLAPWEQRATRCRLSTPAGEIEVVAVHLATPRHGLEELRGSRLEGVEEMNRNTAKRRFEAKLVSEFASRFPGPSIVAGDFNTPVESRVYRRYWTDWQNAFSQAGLGFGYTKYTRYWGVRIDHILVSSHWRVTSAWVGPDLGGDHRPVIAEMALRPGSETFP